MEAQSPPSKISRSIVSNGKAAAGSVSYGFTLMQLQELQQQSLIYNYIQARIPVPIYLILPILWSFPKSLSHHFYPKLFDLNPENSIKNSEPWRCRRTDGRRWRCTKSAVHGQKYCHIHIHRGRSRLCSTTATTTANRDL